MAIIDTASIAMNITRSLGFNTFRSIIISGTDSAVTAIIKARAVPIGIPLSINTATKGIIPAALEYNGTPISTAMGTAKGLPGPAYVRRKSEGTYPCIMAPIPMATTT